MARRLFDEWFVHFRFPGHDGHKMVETEHGQLPEGWEVSAIGDVCVTIRSGSTPSRKRTALWENGNLDWYTTGELRDRFLQRSIEQVSPAAISAGLVRTFPAGAIFLALYGASIGRLGVATAECSCNQAALAMVPDTRIIGRWYLWECLWRLKAHFISIAQGAAQQNISKEKVATTIIVTPPREHTTRFEAAVEPMWGLRERLEAQQATLAASRDLLLPRLISGELSVIEAERELDAAA